MEATVSLDIDIVYGPTVSEMFWVSALDFMSGAKVFTVRKVRAIKERPITIRTLAGP